jgi:hypothetical protein
MTDDELVPTFIPSLVALLCHDEKARAAPLTREEVLAIRDNGVCIMLPRSQAAKLAESRGYDDIDPEQVWEQWQVVREDLQRLGEEE